MKQGTWSVLLGCHSAFHSMLVLIAWVKLYGSLPSWWELVCIVIHDIGHWGKNYLDDLEQKRQHWELGAKLAKRLLGDRGFLLVAGHDWYSGHPESRLLKPDKYAFYIAPKLWLFTNLLVEPKIRSNGMGRWEHVNAFRKVVRKKIDAGIYQSSHDVFLGQKEMLKPTKGGNS